MSNPFSNPGGGAPPAIPARGSKPGAGAGADSPGDNGDTPERTLMTKQQCLVYKIPPQVTTCHFSLALLNCL